MSERDGFEQRPFALPPGATEVILVRHGASAPAVRGVNFPLHDGHGDPPLSEPGQAQARLVAERLRHEPIARAFMTPLCRTHQTAAPYLEATGMVAPIVPDLVEVYLGDWAGGEYRVRVAQRDPIIARMHELQDWGQVPGAESMQSLAARTYAGIQHIVAETGPDATAVAFVHGAVIGELCRRAADSRPFAFVHADNGSISRIVVDDTGRWLLRCFNDTAHLSVPARVS